MRNGTKLGLILIALAWLAASTGIAAHFVARAMEGGARNIEFMDPRRTCGSVPADVRSQGGLWVWASAGCLQCPEGAWSQL